MGLGTPSDGQARGGVGTGLRVANGGQHSSVWSYGFPCPSPCQQADGPVFCGCAGHRAACPTLGGGTEMFPVAWTDSLIIARCVLFDR